jgi:hypothetical protein
MDAVKLSEKKKLNAQPAKEPAPTKDLEGERAGFSRQAEQVSSEKEISLDTKAPNLSRNAEQTSSPEPFKLIPDFKISGKAKTMAKSVGIDLSSIEEMAPRMNDWAASVEQRLNLLVTAIPELPMATIKLLREEAEKQRAAMTQQAQTFAGTAGQPAKGGFDIGSIVEVLKQTGVLGGGGGSGVSDEITKQVIDAGIKQMFAGTRLLETIQNKIMTDMGVKAVTEAVTPK